MITIQLEPWIYRDWGKITIQLEPKLNSCGPAGFRATHIVYIPQLVFSSKLSRRWRLGDRRTSRAMLSDANLPARSRAPPSAAGRRAPKRNYRELAGEDSDDDGGDPSSPKPIRRGLAGAGWEKTDSSSHNRKERGLSEGNWWEDGDSWGWSIRKKPRSARRKVGRASVSDEEERRWRAKKKGQIPGRKRRRRRYESDPSYSPRAVSLRSLVTYTDGEDGGSSPTNVKRVCSLVISFVRLFFLCGCLVLVDLFCCCCCWMIRVVG